MQTVQMEAHGATVKTAAQWLWMMVTYLIAAGCLYWVFHDIPFLAVLQSMVHIHWGWLLPAIMLNLLVYGCVGWEWQWLLRPVGRLSLLKSVQAVFVGRFANDVFPMHIGYLLRLYLASRWMGASIPAVIPSLLIERLLDTFWLVLGIGLTLLFFPLPANLVHTGQILGALTLLGILVLAWWTLRQSKGLAESKRPPPRWKLIQKLGSLFQHVSEGVRGIGRSRVLLVAIGLSLLKVMVQGTAFLCVLWAYDFGLPIWVELAVFLIAFVGISLPSTPASLGVFQFFCTAGLTFFAIPKPAASGFSLLAFVVLTAPLSMAGFIALAQSGLTRRQIRSEIEHWKHLAKEA